MLNETERGDTRQKSQDETRLDAKEMGDNRRALPVPSLPQLWIEKLDVHQFEALMPILGLILGRVSI